jgi:alpha-beta hydrolase superfamily lysophospholipase
LTETYTWRGGSEGLLRHGAGSPITLLILPALFEEANRMRRFTVSVMRELATRGVGTILPDLPGTGESLTELAEVSFDDWQAAIDSLSETIRGAHGKCLTVAIRGGAVLDAAAEFGWRLAPESGERVLRDLLRATALSSGTSAGEIDRLARVQPTTLAGQQLSPALYNALSLASISTGDRRTARLTDDAGLRDVSLDGTRLWRNAEPGDDPGFVQAVASDIAEWTATCASR